MAHGNMHRRTRTRTRAVAIGATTALTASVALALSAGTAQAAVSMTVSATGSDGNPCTSSAPCKTVQRAVNLAGLYAEPQDVTINVGAGTFAENATPASAVIINTFTVNPLSITIVGAGADKTIIKPAGTQRVFGIGGSFPVTLKGMTIRDGAPAAAAVGTSGQPGAAGLAGGGIARTGSGDLTLTDVALLNNTAGAGGKGFDGPAGADGSGGTANGANGTASTAGGAGGSGGGVAFLGTGNLTITGSTFASNKAGNGGDGGKGGNGGVGRTTGTDGEGGDGVAGSNGGLGGAGGGIAFAGNALTVTNSTIVSNLTGRGGNGGAGGNGGRGGGSPSPTEDGGNAGAGGNGGNSGPGGGIELLTGAVTAALTHATIAANAVHVGGSAGAAGTAGAGVPAGTAAANGSSGLLQTSAGVHRTAGALTVGASLLSNQPANCAGTAGNITPTYSVASDDSCFSTGGGLVVDPAAGNLSALAANGGTVQTSAVAAGNPAIGSVPAASCLPKDQRGQDRPGLTGPDTCTAGAFEPQKPPVAPTIQGVISAAHGKTKYDWYRDTVTVTFTCTPGSSPLTAPCPAPMVLSGQGANQGGTVTITNTQGLTSSLKVSVNIDKGLPKIAIKGVKNGALYNKAKKIKCNATDSLSGPYVCQVTGKAKLVKNNTQVKVTYQATAADRAGNVSTKKGKYFYKVPS